MDDLGATRWWKYPRDSPELARAVITAWNQIQHNTLGLQTRFLRNMRSFGGYGYMTGARFPSNTGAGGPLGQGQRMGPRDNIIYTVISTVCSQLLDDGPPGVAFMTSHGNFEQQHRAELLEKFTDGLLDQCDFDDESVLSLFDACICGTGFAEFYEDSDQSIRAERVFPAEYAVDIFDGRDRKPRSLFRCGFIDRDVLAERYPKSKKRILDMKPMSLPGFSVTTTGSITNVIPWIKAWRLPSSKTANDGRHTIVLANDLVLFDDEYTEQDFPVSVLRYELLPTGFHGMGLGELLAGHQLSLNNANTAEYWAWSQVALPRIWAQTGTLDKNHLNSSMSGTILEGTMKPEVLNWSATHPDFVQWKAALKQSAFQLAGITQNASEGSTPARFESGAAQREWKDTQHSRFSILSQRWQKFRVDAAYKSIAAARQSLDPQGSYVVKIIGKNLYTEIDLKNCLLDEDQFVIQAKPVSQIPKSIAGQIQTGTEMLQSTLYTREEARKIITSIPDVGAAADLENAALDNAKRAAYLILHEGKKDQRPDGALQNLQLLQQVVSAETLRAMDNDAPHDRIQAAIAYLAAIKNEQKKLAPPMPSPGMPSPGEEPPGGGQPALARGAPVPINQALPFAHPKAA